MHSILRYIVVSLFAVTVVVAGAEPVVELISLTSSGSAADDDCGMAFSFNHPVGITRPSAVVDTGRVYFLARPQLTDADTNNVVDLYQSTDSGPIFVTQAISSFTGNLLFGRPADDGSRIVMARDSGTFPVITEISVAESNSDAVVGVVAGEIFGFSASGAGGHVAYEVVTVNGRRTLFWRALDAVSEAAVDVTESANLDSFSPVLTHDGQSLVFASLAFNLVTGDENGRQDIFRYEVRDQSFSLAAVRLGDGNHGDAGADQPAVSSDGSVVVFSSADSSFVAGDTNGVQDIFVRENDAITTRIRGDVAPPDGASDSPALSADGRFIVFRSLATNLTSGVGNGHFQVFLYDRADGGITCLSVNGGDLADADCFAPDISPNGRFVTFSSRATNLSAADTGGYMQVYRVDRGSDFLNHRPTVRSRFLSGSTGQSRMFYLTASDEDRDEVTFSALELPSTGTLRDRVGTDIVVGATYDMTSFPWEYVGGGGDTYLRFSASDGIEESAPADVRLLNVDAQFGVRNRINMGSGGEQTSEHSPSDSFSGLDVSDNGGRIVFASTSATQLGGRSIGISDIYLFDRFSDELTLLSDGFPLNTNCWACVISGDGTYVAYITQDDNQLILQQIENGLRTTVASLAVEDMTANARLGLSRDGSRLVFQHGGIIKMYNRHDASTTVVHAGESPAISADGRVVAYTVVNEATRAAQLTYLPDGSSVQLAADGDTVCLSASGRFTAYVDSNGTLWRAVAAEPEAAVMVAANAHEPALSANGRFIYFTQNNEFEIRQAYRFDSQAVAPGIALLSSDGAGSDGDGHCVRGVLSADGAQAIVASEASNLVGSDTNGRRDVFAVDLGNTGDGLPSLANEHVEVDEDATINRVAAVVASTEADDVEVELVTGPAHAAEFIVLNNPLTTNGISIAYRPVPDFEGEDFIVVRLHNGAGHVIDATITVTVIHAPDAPVLTVTGDLALMDTRHGDIDLGNVHVVDPDFPSGIVAANYSIRLAEDPTSGTISDALGNDVTALQATSLSNLPLTFTSLTAYYAVEELRLIVRDEEGLESEPMPFSIESGVWSTSVSLDVGWNLVALPLDPRDIGLANPETFFRINDTPCLRGAVKEWDAAAGRFTSVSVLQRGVGYWVQSTVRGVIHYVGTFDHGHVSTDGGEWNLRGPVGPGDERLSVALEAGVDSPWWGWDPIRQRPYKVRTLHRGRSYWFKAVPEAISVELEMELDD